MSEKKLHQLISIFSIAWPVFTGIVAAIAIATWVWVPVYVVGLGGVVAAVALCIILSLFMKDTDDE